MTLALRAKISVWYKNAILPGRTWCPIRGGIAEANAKSIGFELPKGSLGSIFAAWKVNFRMFTIRKEKYDAYVLKRQAKLSAVNKLVEAGLSVPEKSKPISSSRGPKEPEPVPAPEELMSASIEKALRFSESFLKWLELQAESPRVPIDVDDWYRLTLALIGLYMSGTAESFIKLKLATFDAISKHQTELPPVTAPFIERTIRTPTFLPGPAGRRLGVWIMKTLARAQAFVFFMKRASAEMSEEQITAAEIKSFKILTTPHVDTTYRIDFAEKAVTVSPATLKEQVIRTVQESFGGAVFKTSRPVQVPSANAHFKNGRAKGGAKARVAARQPSLVSFLDMLTRVPTLNKQTKLASIAIAISRGCDGGCGGACALCIRLEHNQGWIPLPKDWQSIVNEATRENSFHRAALLHVGFCPPNEQIGAEEHQLVHWFDELVHAWASRDLTQHAHRNAGSLPAKIIGLPEPLKIRTITAGPEEAYFEASYLQKFVHGHLRKHPVFRLIGQPLTLVDIQETFKRPLRLGEFFVSGDYKSATDLISGALSTCAARALADVVGMSSHLSDLFVACLTGHEIHLKEQKLRDLQQNGQLMGSPLSFPILCLINAALTRYALELRNDTVGKTALGDYPLLINGDDVGFVTDQDGYTLWKTITKMGGLVFSEGKNFTSTEFIVLNSCMFELKARTVPRPMRETTTSRRAFPESNFKLDHAPVTGGVERCIPYCERAADFEVIAAHGYAHLHEIPRWLQKDYWAATRNVFDVSAYLNPDYLGPVCRRVPSQCSFLQADRATALVARKDRHDVHQFIYDGIKHGDIKDETVRIVNQFAYNCDRLEDMPAFRRYKIKDIDDLFRPEGYAILPGLQQAWLGSHRGTYRHRLNLEFLRSWKPVLALSSGVSKGGIPYTTDYWLPTGLGGLGLENTDPDRTIEASSLASRKLAFWLFYHPERAPAAMPAINFFGELAEKAYAKYNALPPVFFKTNEVLPPGYVTQQDVIGVCERISWMETFQMEEDGPIWVRAMNKDERGEVLDESLRNYAQSRARLWKFRKNHKGDEEVDKTLIRNDWWACPPISEGMLAAYSPPQRCYRLSLPNTPKTDLRPLGTATRVLPLLGLARKVDGCPISLLQTTILDIADEIQHIIPEWFDDLDILDQN